MITGTECLLNITKSHTSKRTAILAWEIGQGLGHIQNLINIGAVLETQGYRIIFILKNTSLAKLRYQGMGAEFLQAPVLTGPLSSIFYVKGNSGFLDSLANKIALDTWKGYFRTYQPFVIIFDSAPIALLASQSHSFKKIILGTGWNDPPYLYHGQTQLRIDCTILTTFPTLDRFASGRSNEYYLGPLFLSLSKKINLVAGCRIVEEVEVLVYLKSDCWAVESVLSALHDLQINALVYCPGFVKERLAVDLNTVQFSFNPIDFQKYLPSVKLIICNGSANTIATALRFGVPSVSCPSQPEQRFIAEQVAALGAGVALNHFMDRSRIREMIKIALNSESLNAGAISFAEDMSLIGEGNDPTLSDILSSQL